MKMLKIKKWSVSLTLVISLILSLMMSTSAFAAVAAVYPGPNVVYPGPNGQYCTITSINGVNNAWQSTASSPMYGARGSSGTDLLGNPGGVPVSIQFSAYCSSFQFMAAQCDSTGNIIGNWNVFAFDNSNPKNPLPDSLKVQLPSSWFTAGNEYQVYSFGAFPGLSEMPSSIAYVKMLN